MRKLIVSLILVALSGIDIFLFPCSQVFIKTDKQITIARNEDWETSDGNIVINERSANKIAFGSKLSGLNPMKWVSKFGSITFNLTVKVPDLAMFLLRMEG